MKKGDKVRFLHEQGGGKVKEIRSGGIVIVTDDDGFDVPTAARDLVVVQSDNYDVAMITTRQQQEQEHHAQQPSGRSVKAMLSATDSDDTTADNEPADKEITFKAPAIERKGADKLAAYLAFVPIDANNISNTRFEAYLINDSNYHMQMCLLSCDNNAWSLRHNVLVNANTKVFIEEIGHEDLQHIAHIAIQAIAYKEDKTFLLKQTIDVQLRVDPVKFYKLHAFHVGDFFEQPALLMTIIENDQPARPLVLNAEDVKQHVYDKQQSPATDTYVTRYQQRPGKKNPFITKRRDDSNSIIVDLHAEQLLDTTAGMSAADILNYQLTKFREVLNDNANRKGLRIIFIHGKGEGVLRRAIVSELNYRYKSYTFQDASFQEYGYGATQVTIK